MLNKRCNSPTALRGTIAESIELAFETATVSHRANGDHLWSLHAVDFDQSRARFREIKRTSCTAIANAVFSNNVSNSRCVTVTCVPYFQWSIMDNLQG